MIQKVETLHPERIEETLTRLSKKLKRKNLPPIVVRSHTTQERVIEVPIDEAHPDILIKKTLIDHIYEIDIPDESAYIKNKGVEYVAKVEQTAGEENLIWMADESEDLWKEAAENYGKGMIPCDHCGRRINRTRGYVFKNGAGKLLCIGSTCVDEYFGIDVEKLLDMRSIIGEAIFAGGLDDETREMLRSYKSDLGLWRQFFAVSRHLIKIEGYISKSKVEMGQARQSTASSTNAILSVLNTCHTDLKEEFEKQYRKELNDIEAWKSFLNFYETLDPKSNFETNMKSIVLTMDVTRDGIMAYAVWKHYLETVIKPREEAAKKARKPSEWIGKEGERIETDVLVLKSIEKARESMGYGYKSCYYINKMITPEGNLLTWFGSKPMEEETECRIRATVKKHEEYRGEKITVVTRVMEKVVENGSRISII